MLIYFGLDQFRYFIKNDDGTKCLTVWKRPLLGKSYVILGEYYGIVSPKQKYVQVAPYAHLSIVWDSLHNYSFSFSIYPLNHISDSVFTYSEEKIAFYQSQRTLLENNSILDSVGFNGKYYYKHHTKHYQYYDLGGYLPLKLLYTTSSKWSFCWMEHPQFSWRDPSFTSASNSAYSSNWS